MSNLPVDFFPSDADGARRQFRKICEAAGLEIWTLGRSGSPSVDQEDAQAAIEAGDVADDDGYIIEAARIGSPDAPSVLVLTSGAGESEGLCASAIQCSALAGPIRRELPRDVGMLFVHAIAPQWDDNEVHANFPAPERAWEDALLVAAESRYAQYVKDKSSSKFSSDKFGGNTADAADAKTGNPQKPSPEEGLRALVEEYLGRAQKIGLIDIRTGDGEYGRCDVIASAGKTAPAGQRAGRWFGARTDLDGISSSAIPGPLAQTLITLMPPVELAAVVMEFGTYSMGGMLGSAPGRMFYPDDPAWRAQVWRNAYTVIHNAMGILTEA